MKAQDSIKSAWNPAFPDRSPAFGALARAAQPLRDCVEWPDLEVLQRLCDAGGLVNARAMPLRLVGTPGDDSYETRIYLRGEMHVQCGDWHDLLNVLAWLSYPRAKAALNERHYLDGAARAPARGRSRLRDALTLFDESGVVVASSDSTLLEDVRALRWKALFWTRRRRLVDCLRVYVFGHALAQKALAPYVGMTAHALLCEVDEAFLALDAVRQVQRIDSLTASAIAGTSAFETPRRLAPLPVLGIPGWHNGNEHEAFYDNSGYFRGARRRG